MLGAATYGAYSNGPKLMEGLMQLDQAKKQQRQQALSANLIGNYLQQMAAGGMPDGAQAPSPGQASTPAQAMYGPTATMPGSQTPTNPNQTPPGAAAAPTSAGAAPSGQAPMSLDGLMKFLSDRGVTGEDAYATAAQFMPWLSRQDQEQMNQAKLSLDLQKLLMQYGWNKQRAKQAAANLAERKKRDKDLEGLHQDNQKIAGLNRVVQQLTIGKQKLAAQRDAIVNAARNQNRALSAQELQAIDDINSRIQKVDAGMAEARKQQAGMQGVDESKFIDTSSDDLSGGDYTGSDDSGGQ